MTGPIFLQTTIVLRACTTIIPNSYSLFTVHSTRGLPVQVQDSLKDWLHNIGSENKLGLGQGSIL